MSDMSSTQRLLVLWPTSKCNLKCKYCYASGISGEDMNFETAKRALDLMSDSPLKIQFAGGEPLLNLPLIERVLEYASAECNTVSFSIQTNGTILNDEIIDVLKRYKVAIGVSLDGKPETNNYLRGNTKAVIDNILLLRDHGLMTNLTVVVSDYNVGKLAETIDLAMYLGNINGIGLDLLRKAGRADEPNSPVGAADGASLGLGLRALYEHLQKINSVYPRKIIVREFEKACIELQSKTINRDYCYAAQGNSFVVLPNGDCYPCGSLAYEKQYYMGNVYTAVVPIPIRCERPAICEECEYGAICPGGCPSRVLLCGGFDELDCVMKKTIYTLIEETDK